MQLNNSILYISKICLLASIITLPISSFAKDVGANLRNMYKNGSYLEAVPSPAGDSADGFPNKDVIKGWPAKKIKPGDATTMQVWLDKNRGLGEENNAWAVYNVYTKKHDYVMTVTFRVSNLGGSIEINGKIYTCSSGTCEIGD